jgi:DNA-directed RNA polymerase alpha subunit
MSEEYELRKEPHSIGVDFFKRFERNELLEIRGLIDSVLADKKFQHPISIAESYRSKHISIRTRKALLQIDITYWHELATYSIPEIKRIRNCGGRTITEILEQVKLRGIKLKS